MNPVRLLILALCIFLASSCQDSSSADYTIVDCKSSKNEDSDVVCDTIKDYLPLDDSEYPYAGIPRIVIETRNRREIKDRETEIPAKLQIWGGGAPESEVIELTIRGRGNSSWSDMPKKSYKIKFNKKRSVLGLPKDKDWALIANFADKTLLKNYITYRLAKKLTDSYVPNARFVELILNNEYLGVYLLTETIKKSSHRVSFSENAKFFLAEFDAKFKDSSETVFTSSQKPITIHYVQNTESSKLKQHLDSLENLLQSTIWSIELIDKWIDIEEYIFFYWMQEFTKNEDGAFFTSVYFSWEEGFPIKMGPVWDFDLAYGGYGSKSLQEPDAWRIRRFYWNEHLFKNPEFRQEITKYWSCHQSTFKSLLDSIDYYQQELTPAARNNFKRWNVLKSTDNKWHHKSYETYEESIRDLKNWIAQRVNWIQSNI